MRSSSSGNQNLITEQIGERFSFCSSVKENDFCSGNFSLPRTWEKKNFYSPIFGKSFCPTPFIVGVSIEYIFPVFKMMTLFRFKRRLKLNERRKNMELFRMLPNTLTLIETQRQNRKQISSSKNINAHRSEEESPRNPI